MSRFIQVSRHQQYLLPPSVDEWLPDNHLARFIVEVIEQLDLRGCEFFDIHRGRRLKSLLAITRQPRQNSSPNHPAKPANRPQEAG